MKLLSLTLAGFLAIALNAYDRTDPSPALPGHLVRVSGPSPYSRCSPPSDTYPGAEVEPQIAANPATIATSHLNLIGVWQQDRYPDGGARGLVAASSFDGGRTWRAIPLPFTTCTRGGLPYQVASDPWVSIGPDGTAYASALVGNPFRREPEWGVAVATSRDGGRSWRDAQTVMRDACCHFSDKESVTADPTRPGVAYVVWNRNESASVPTWFAKTGNRGETWSRPRPIVRGRSLVTIANQIVVDPRSGTLYDILNLARQRWTAPRSCQGAQQHSGCPRTPREARDASLAWSVAITRSSNGGDTWSGPRTIASDQAVGVPAYTRRLRTGADIPSAAINPANGTLYMVWQDARFTHGAYDEIVLTKSSDGGTHWTRPMRVGSGTNWPAFTPSVSVNARGVIGVTFYRLREVGSDNGTLPTDYWFAWSSDGGTHFRERHLAGPFDMLVAPRSDGPFLGDYEGLVAVRNGFVPLFVQTNRHDPASRTDVFATVIAP